MSKKLYPILIILVAVLILAGGVYFGVSYVVEKNAVNQGSANVNTAAPKSAIADWRTYKNDKYGFEVNYPGDWKIDSGRSSGNEVVFDTNIPESRESIKVDKNINNLTFEQLKQQKIAFYKTVTLNTAETIIDGEKAIIIETGEFGITRIFFLHKGMIYEVTTGGGINKIGYLDSFKFTNSIDTSNWQTYKNDKYGFEVKYPAEIKIQEQGSDFVKIGTGYPFNYNLADAYEVGIYCGNKEEDFAHETAGYKQKTESIRLDNIAAIKTTWQKDNNKEMDIDFKKGFYAYEIRLVTTLDGKYDSVFNQILSTFKFTK